MDNPTQNLLIQTNTCPYIRVGILTVLLAIPVPCWDWAWESGLFLNEGRNYQSTARSRRVTVVVFPLEVEVSSPYRGIAINSAASGSPEFITLSFSCTNSKDSGVFWGSKDIATF